MSGMSAARHISRMDFVTAISSQIRSTISAPYFDDTCAAIFHAA
jgi:hypothetical protein